MALISCRECGKEISDRASICPYCARPDPAPPFPWALVLVIVFVVILALFVMTQVPTVMQGRSAVDPKLLRQSQSLVDQRALTLLSAQQDHMEWTDSAGFVTAMTRGVQFTDSSGQICRYVTGVITFPNQARDKAETKACLSSGSWRLVPRDQNTFQTEPNFPQQDMTRLQRGLQSRIVQGLSQPESNILVTFSDTTTSAIATARIGPSYNELNGQVCRPVEITGTFGSLTPQRILGRGCRNGAEWVLIPLSGVEPVR